LMPCGMATLAMSFSGAVWRISCLLLDLSARRDVLRFCRAARFGRVIVTSCASIPGIRTCPFIDKTCRSSRLEWESRGVPAIRRPPLRAPHQPECEHFIRLPGGFDRYEGRQSNGLFGEPRGVGSARRRALGCVSTV
jgi:hypothetical protein